MLETVRVNGVALDRATVCGAAAAIDFTGVLGVAALLFLDASIPAGAVTDGVTDDGATADGDGVDGAVTDGAVGDGAVGDGAVGDGAVGDGETADGTAAAELAPSEGVTAVVGAPGLTGELGSTLGLGLGSAWAIVPETIGARLSSSPSAATVAGRITSDLTGRDRRTGRRGSSGIRISDRFETSIPFGLEISGGVFGQFNGETSGLGKVGRVTDREQNPLGR